MFVPLFLTGGGFGVAFAQSIVHSSSTDLYAAVGMAAFIAGCYKTPLTAVVFVAEATGGHAYIVPTLIGAAVAYAISGEASVSGDQRLHEAVKVADLWKVPVTDAMQRQIVSVDAVSTLNEFVAQANAHPLHDSYPVYEGDCLAGVMPMYFLSRVPMTEWDRTTVGAVMERDVTQVSPECDLMEAARILSAEHGQHLLPVVSASGKLEGILTHSDLLTALNSNGNGSHSQHRSE